MSSCPTTVQARARQSSIPKGSSRCHTPDLAVQPLSGRGSICRQRNRSGRRYLARSGSEIWIACTTRRTLRGCAREHAGRSSVPITHAHGHDKPGCCSAWTHQRSSRGRRESPVRRRLSLHNPRERSPGRMPFPRETHLQVGEPDRVTIESLLYRYGSMKLLNRSRYLRATFGGTSWATRRSTGPSM